jgi:hypothetical protein
LLALAIACFGVMFAADVAVAVRQEANGVGGVDHEGHVAPLDRGIEADRGG